MTITKGEEESQEIVVNEFLKELEVTAEQVKNLLEELDERKTDFIEIKTELRILVKDVQNLSGLVRDGDGRSGILTRIALIEKSIEDLKSYADRDVTEDANFVTRIALVEQSVEKITTFMPSLYNKMEKIEEKNQNLDNRLVKIEDKSEKEAVNKIGKWKVYSAVATGVISFIAAVTLAIIKIFFG